jgi:hypothetical protein
MPLMNFPATRQTYTRISYDRIFAIHGHLTMLLKVIRKSIETHFSATHLKIYSRDLIPVRILSRIAIQLCVAGIVSYAQNNHSTRRH